MQPLHAEAHACCKDMIHQPKVMGILVISPIYHMASEIIKSLI